MDGMTLAFLICTKCVDVGGGGDGGQPPPSHVWTPITGDSSYRLVFDDEFNGAALNLGKWSPSDKQQDHTYSGTSAYYQSSNVTVHDGCMDMKIDKPAGGVAGFTYSTAAVTGLYPHGGVAGPGVYWETRTKYSPSTIGNNKEADYGLAEDFWTNTGPLNTTWQYPEIDFSEWWGFRPSWTNGNWNPGPAGGNAWYPSTPGHDFGEDLTTGWHVWGTWWTNDAITFYLDGVQFYTTSAHVNQNNSVWYTLLTATVAGNSGNNPNANTVFPANYDIDYVHIYAQTGTAVSPEANYGGAGDAVGDTQCAAGQRGAKATR